MESRRGPCISVEHVTAGYRSGIRRVAALRDLSLFLLPGEVTGLVGPNGAGKSTLLRLVLGLRLPWAGRIRVDDTDPRRYRARSGAGYMPESVSLPGHWSPTTLLRCGAQLHGLPSSSWGRVARKACRDVGLDSVASRPLGSLSRGQTRRALMAFALLGEPRLVVLDEPWTHLDEDGRARLRAAVRRFADTGATVAVSSHELEEVSRVADTTHVIVDGARADTLRDGRSAAGNLARSVLRARDP